MWNLIASSKYLEHKYQKDSLHHHYSNLYDIDINYHRRNPVQNTPSKDGKFLLGIEKDCKQKNIRRKEISLENAK